MLRIRTAGTCFVIDRGIFWLTMFRSVVFRIRMVHGYVFDSWWTLLAQDGSFAAYGLAAAICLVFNLVGCCAKG